MKTLVYGLARSGRSAAERLDDPVLVDRSLGNEDDLSLLDDIDVLVKSPGVPGEAPLVRAARERGIPVWSEIELVPERPVDGRHVVAAFTQPLRR